MTQRKSEGREEVLYHLKLDELRRDIQVGVDQADRGEVVSEQEAMAQLKAHHDELQKAGKK